MSVEITEVTQYVEGVSPGAVEVVEDHLRRGRRYFGSAGAGLTHQAYNTNYKSDGKINRKSALIGIDAERKTSDALREWIKDKPEAVLIDSVHIKGFGDTVVNEETGLVEGGDTDHVLIIGSQVLIVDTKRWKQKRVYSVSNKGAILRSTGKGKPARSFPGGRINIRGALGIWRGYLSDTEAKTMGLICVHPDSIFVKIDDNWFKQSFRITSFSKLYQFLDRHYKNIPAGNKDKIHTEIVAKAAASTIMPYDRQKEMGLNLG